MSAKAPTSDIKTLLADLGKPTLRGIRKCPRCGTLNGTRGLTCKNKLCGVVFKEGSRRAAQTLEPVKIQTGSNAQVYSVRLRERGPDYRGFVQLPIVEGIDQSEIDPTLIMQHGTCFIEACSRVNDVVQGSQPCQHIKAAVTSFVDAEPFSLNAAALDSMQHITSDLKHSIWSLAAESPAPLVQRVSKNVMVVACTPTPKSPLGFLHFFFSTAKKKNQVEYKFNCSCKEFKSHKILINDDYQRRCVHFYACICAFASNPSLAEEFSFFINIDQAAVVHEEASKPPSTTTDTAAVSLFQDVEQPLADPELEPEANILEAAEQVMVGETQLIIQDESADMETAQAGSALLTLHDSAGKKTPTKRPCPVVVASYTPVKKCGFSTSPIEESSTLFSFNEWLSSVTERINQTMHYQFDGNPEPLVFHAPQRFFDCLAQRLSAGLKKKRLPNSTSTFVRKDALPLGVFSKFTWQITNVLHVKQIFDTVECPLEVTRSFIECKDGTYHQYEPPKVQVEEITDQYRKTNSQPLIKPFELKTFIKVGNMSPDQKEPIPFIIEWIPNILPKSEIGELRIKFQYGHQRNGQMEVRCASSTVDIDPDSVLVPGTLTMPIDSIVT